MRIHKISSLKNRVAQFAITDPRILLFVRKYENLVPWGELIPAKVHEGGRERAQYQLNDVARGLVESRLRPMMDRMSDNNIYVESIDLRSEAMQNADNPEIRQALSIYDKDPAGAEKKVLDIINGDKEDIFRKWFDYISGMYLEEHGCFAFTMLAAALKESDAKRTNPPPPMNSNAIALMFERANGNDSNVMKDYSSAVVETSKGARKSFADGWVMIPGKPRSDEDPERWGEYQDNLSVLRTYGSAGRWCIGGSEWSNTYLSMGDFHILVENGSPVVAIRLEGTNRLAEIDGKGNDKDIVREKWEAITDFLHASDIDYEGQHQYRELKSFVEENEMMAMMSEDEMYESVAGISPSEIAMRARKMSKGNRKKFADALARAARYSIDHTRKLYPDRTLVTTGVDSIRNLPEEFQERQVRRPWGWMKIVEMPDDRVVVTYYDKVPIRIEWMEEPVAPSPEKAWGDYVENWVGWSKVNHDGSVHVDERLSAIRAVVESVTTMPDFVTNAMGRDELMGEVSVEVAHMMMSKTTGAPLSWDQCEEAMRPVMGDYEWNVLSEGVLRRLDSLATTERGFGLTEELSERNGDEWRRKFDELAREEVYSNIGNLEYFCEGFLMKYTPVEQYYEQEKKRQEESPYDFDHDECMDVALEDCLEDVSAMAAEEGKMHMLNTYDHLDSSDRRMGWDNTVERYADDAKVINEFLIDHSEGFGYISTSTAEKVINANPDMAYQIIKNIGDNVSWPLELNDEAIETIWMEEPYNDIGHLADISGVDLSRMSQEFIEEVIVPERGAYLPEIIKAVGPEWEVPEEMLDEYVDSNSNAVEELSSTGNPYVIRYLRERLSPADREIYVDPNVDEATNDMARNIPEPHNPNQMELPLEYSNTWMGRYVVKESGLDPTSS